MDSQELEEEILRQIVEEGLLEGINLDNIDHTQEEQIQERILESFQRRRRERAAERRGDESSTSRAHGTSDAPTTSTEARPEGGSSQGQTSRPPISRPRLRWM